MASTVFTTTTTTTLFAVAAAATAASFDSLALIVTKAGGLWICSVVFHPGGYCVATTN